MNQKNLTDTPRIRKAVIPVAGLGTRFLPATRSIPKALLPVLETPLVDYAVREAASVEIKDIAIVVSPGMEAVPKYFETLPNLESALEQSGHIGSAEQQREIARIAKITTVIQQEPKGLGHAVSLTKEWVAGEPFALILPDDLIFGHKSGLEQLLEVRCELGGQVIAAERISPALVSTKGIIEGKQDRGIISVTALTEKPPVEKAASDLAIVGRYLLEPSIFERLEHGNITSGGEIQITDAIIAGTNVRTFGKIIEGRHIDAGNPAGMLQAAIFEASRRHDLRNVLEEFIAEQMQS